MYELQRGTPNIMQDTGSTKEIWFTQLIFTAGFLSILTAGAFGAFGAIVQYLYMVIRDDKEEFFFKKAFLFSVMGFFVGIVAAEIMDEFFGEVYTGVVLVSGFLFLKILDLLDQSGLNFLVKKIDIRKVDKK